ERLSCLLEGANGLPVRRPCGDLLARLTEVANGPVPRLAAEGVTGEALDVLDEPIRIQAFDGGDDPGVQNLTPFLKQRPVGDFMGERVLEGVLQVRKQARLVEKLGLLKMPQPPP